MRLGICIWLVLATIQALVSWSPERGQPKILVVTNRILLADPEDRPSNLEVL